MKVRCAREAHPFVVRRKVLVQLIYFGFGNWSKTSEQAAFIESRLAT